MTLVLSKESRHTLVPPIYLISLTCSAQIARKSCTSKDISTSVESVFINEWLLIFWTGILLADEFRVFECLLQIGF